MNNKNVHSIRIAARESGLSAHVIRVWEKRYSAILPKRSPSGHRLYDEDVIHRLRLLSELTRRGYRISHVAGLTNQDLEKELNKVGRQLLSAPVVENGTISSDLYLTACIEAVYSLRAADLRQVLDRALINISQRDLLETIVIPLLQKVGDEWHAGRLSIAAEHISTQVIHAFLNQLRSSYTIDSTAPNMVVATPIGQDHEMGALIVSTIAGQEGWRAHYCGYNLPVEEITRICEELNPQILALSLTYLGKVNLIKGELDQLSRSIGSDTKVIVGGSSAELMTDYINSLGFRVMTDMEKFRDYLLELG